MNLRTSLPLVPALLTVLLVAGHASANVRMPAIFSNHMVLQRDVPVPVWGWADPGESVSVSIAGQTKTGVADAKGKWSVTLDKLAAGESATLTLKGSNTVTIEDVSIGEVWLGSGQSNMQLQVNAVNNLAAEKAGAKFPQIRMFAVVRRPSASPQAECGGSWVICTPETVGNFSAACYFFGRELHKTLKTPVGLIDSSWGGTPIETWTSMEVMEGRKELAPVLAEWKKKTDIPYDEAKAKASYEKQMTVWKNVTEKNKADGKPLPQKPKEPVAPRLSSNHPANLFNGMINPLIPYALRGVIWYQGENNANSGGAKLYEMQLPLLISDWRKRWNQGDFPFAWVQLPNFKKRAEDPGAASEWAVMRESMLRSLAVPNTGMAVTIDVGDEANIHPKDKQTVGLRLALWARAKVYGHDIPYSGPLPAGSKVQGSEVTLSFTQTQGGLKAKSGDLKGFAIAGADRKWFWAKARIEGETVIVSSPDVKAPLAVRYAWGDNPDCNLVNGAGLPASPFRTDDWK